MQVATHGVQSVATFVEVEDLELHVEYQCAQGMALVRCECDPNFGTSVRSHAHQSSRRNTFLRARFAVKPKGKNLCTDGEMPTKVKESEELPRQEPRADQGPTLGGAPESRLANLWIDPERGAIIPGVRSYTRRRVSAVELRKDLGLVANTSSSAGCCQSGGSLVSQ